MLLIPFAAMAANPEEAQPNDPPPLASPGDFADLFRRAQEKLRQQGFDPGPINGDFGAKTQAALAQFQRARDLPASGALDDKTLAELGVD